MEVFKLLKKASALAKTSIKGFVMNRYLFRFQQNAFLLTFEEDLLDWKPNIVHCNDWQTLSLGARIKSLVGSRLVFDSHELETHRNPPLPANRKRWMERYEQKHLRQCDFVTTVCEPISEYLMEHYEIEPPLVIYNSPIYPNLYPAHEDWGRLPGESDVRSEANLLLNDFLLVSVGNATVNRGIEDIFEALPGLPEDIHLAIVGKVTPAFKEVLQNLIESRALQKRVHFIEPVNPTCVVDFIRTANVGVISLIPATLSYDYALPNKLFECAFAGLSIVASDTQEVQRKVKNYELGTIYKAGDITELRTALKKAYDQQKAEGNEGRSHQLFTENHGFEACAKKLLSRFEAK